MSEFRSEIREIYEQLEEAWEPPTPSYRAPQNKLAQLAQVMQLSSTAMLQVSRSIAKGNIKTARVKLRSIFRRMDATLHQMDKLQQKMDREKRRR
jgi:hypothetical protein